MNNVFNRGNFNQWEKFALEAIPQTNTYIREVIIPQIDLTLASMLHGDYNIIKEAVNVTQVCDNMLTDLICDLEYIVPSFEVPEAPKKAIDADTEAIRKSLETLDGCTVRELEIDVETGTLKVSFNVPIEVKND